jgi:hypothetical protein
VSVWAILRLGSGTAAAAAIQGPSS